MKRTNVQKRKSTKRKFITTTYRKPWWWGGWVKFRASVRGLRKNAWNLLAGIGLFLVLWQTMLLIGGR